MTLKMSNRKHPVLALVCLVVAVALSATAFSAASAQAESWSGSNPAFTWTTGNGAYYTYTWETAEAPGAIWKICVSPVQWNGSKYVFPWGWQCAYQAIYFPHSAITAAHGVYNPENTRESFYAQFG
jgi:hypothetical protein